MSPPDAGRPAAELDHLVIGAAALDAGVAWAEARFGVAFAGGGAHPRMATHNRLLALDRRAYLEVIAADPAGTPPGRPRWFGLDAPSTRDRLAERPRLVAWAVRVPDIAAIRDRLGPEIGEIETMSRGDLTWKIAVRGDGAPPPGGLPVLIEWPPGPHPVERLPASPCRLARLTVTTPEPASLEIALATLGLADDRVAVVRGNAALSAAIGTSAGTATVD